MGGSGESFLGGASFGMFVNPGEEADGLSENGVDLFGGSLGHVVFMVSGTEILLFSVEFDIFGFVNCSVVSESSILLSGCGFSHISVSLHKSG